MSSGSNQSNQSQEKSQTQSKKGTLGKVVNFTVTTEEIPMEPQTTESSTVEKRDITVTIPAVTRIPGVEVIKYTNEELRGETVTIPATEVKKITTTQTIVPKKIKTTETREYEPVITDLTEGTNRNIQITTPIGKHVTTTTTLTKTTTVTNEITTIISPERNENNRNS